MNRPGNARAAKPARVTRPCVSRWSRPLGPPPAPTPTSVPNSAASTAASAKPADPEPPSPSRTPSWSSPGTSCTTRPTTPTWAATTTPAATTPRPEHANCYANWKASATTSNSPPPPNPPKTPAPARAFDQPHSPTSFIPDTQPRSDRDTGQAHGEHRPTLGSMPGEDLAAVPQRRLLHDGQAEAGAGQCAGLLGA